MTDINAETTLTNLIQKTQQALEEGWIHSQEFQDILDSAKSSISISKGRDDDVTYPEANGFHVLRHD